tara:strand:+ start:110 stop:370 length:261 start_codon:yes stop_codon:yes gene_type:complete
MSKIHTTKENYEELNNEIQSLCNLYFWLSDVENSQHLKFNDEYLNDIDLLKQNIKEKIGGVVLDNHTKSWSCTHPHLNILKEPKDE